MKGTNRNNNKQKRHALLQELRITEDLTQKGPTALEILNYLLENNVVTDEAVRTAHETLRQATTEDKAAKVESTTTSKQQQQQQGQQKLVNSSIRTRHVALEIFYDGEKYSGLAENVGQDNDQSIERALFAALQKCQFITSGTQRDEVKYSRCGRTDKGVSAAGQVVALHLKSAFPPTASWDADGIDLIQDDQLPKNSLDGKTVWVLPRKAKSSKNKSTAPCRQQKQLTEFAYDQVLNKLLPPEIRVLGWVPVSDEFSARFSAGSRTYRYFFHQRHMNLDKMKQGLAYMVGNHDFRNLCKLNVEEVSNFHRQIHQANIFPVNDDNDTSGIYYFEIVGQAFLWHQIRCIVHVLFLVGKGLEEPEVVQELLDVQKHPGKPSYPLADEKPLVLHDCAYPNLQFGYTVRNLWMVACHQEQRWEDLVLAAARIRNSLRKMGQCPLFLTDVQQFCQEKLEFRRKKANKYGQDVNTPRPDVEPPFTTRLITWNEALEWMATLDLFPEPDTSRDMVHTPLMLRSKGTSYEEKVASLQNKRKTRFEENIVKKRQTKEVDQAFYERMTKQGGSAFD